MVFSLKSVRQGDIVTARVLRGVESCHSCQVTMILFFTDVHKTPLTTMISAQKTQTSYLLPFVLYR